MANKPKKALPPEVTDLLNQIDGAVNGVADEITRLRNELKDHPTPEDMASLRTRLDGIATRLKEAVKVPDEPQPPAPTPPSP